MQAVEIGTEVAINLIHKATFADHQNLLKEQWLQRWEKVKKQTIRLSNLYRKSSLPALQGRSNRVKGCGDYLSFLVCKTFEKGHTKKLISGNFCHDRLCPVCNKKRSLKLLPKLYKKLFEFLPDYKLLFLTLTIKNRQTITKRDYSEIWGYWRKYYNSVLLGRSTEKKTRKKVNLGPVVGGVCFLETTYNKKTGYHPHLHCILVAKDYIPQDYLSNKWKEVTGDSFIVGIQEIKAGDNSLRDSVCELCKYIAKVSEFEESKVENLWLALRNTRLFNTFGCLRSLKEESKDSEKDICCSICGNPLEIMLLQYFENKYYPLSL